MSLGIRKRKEIFRHMVLFTILLFSLWSWGLEIFGKNGYSGASERISPTFGPHGLERRMCRRNDVEKSNLTLLDMSVNEISGMGVEIQLCIGVAEGHRIQTGKESFQLGL
jgi:hypothetical protein